MADILRRTGTWLRRTVNQFRADCRFSIYFALLRVCEEGGYRIGQKRLAGWANQKKNQWIYRWLKRQLQKVLDTFRNDSGSGTYAADSPVWVCWWTGEETAPPLVRRCIASTRRNAGSHPVNLITKDNYQKFVQIPDFMLQKVSDGNMGLAHLADYIRVKLLAQYGGLWLDATMFCSNQVPELCFDLPVFTCKGPVRKSSYVSDYRWVTFCLGGWKGNVFYRFLMDAFECYWRHHTYAIDYLFFDHIINLAYENIPAIRQLLDQIPDNNIHRDDLQAAMNAALPASKFREILKPDTVLYKLSWRETYPKKTADGGSSIYKHFLETEG